MSKYYVLKTILPYIGNPKNQKTDENIKVELRFIPSAKLYQYEIYENEGLYVSSAMDIDLALEKFEAHFEKLKKQFQTI